MKLSKGTVVAVADGEILHLYSNEGDEAGLQLKAMSHGGITRENAGSGNRHQSSSANPSDSQQDEDAFAAGTADMLNKRVLENRIDALLVVAAPRTLGELRKHYHKALSAVLVGEIAKDLTGHSIAEIESSITAA